MTNASTRPAGRCAHDGPHGIKLCLLYKTRRQVRLVPCFFQSWSCAFGAAAGPSTARCGARLRPGQRRHYASGRDSARWLSPTISARRATWRSPPNGDVYVALQGEGENGRRRGSARCQWRRQIRSQGTFRRRAASPASRCATVISTSRARITVLRYKMTAGQLKPAGAPETVVTGLARRASARRQRHHVRRQGLALRQRRRAFQCVPDAAIARPKSPVRIPVRFWRRTAASGSSTRTSWARSRRMARASPPAFARCPAIAWHDGALYIAMNNRDSARPDVARHSSPRKRMPSGRPSRCIARSQGSNFGWPYCFYDYGQKKLLLNPEYGGDGKTVGRCGEFTPPVAAFPAHWAPVDLMFYSGNAVPEQVSGWRVHRVPRLVESLAARRRPATTSRSSRSSTASRQAPSRSSPTDSPARIR